MTKDWDSILRAMFALKNLNKRFLQFIFHNFMESKNNFCERAGFQAKCH